MSESLGGLPLLSGPPPELEHGGRAEVACRKCSKEFNILFTRGCRCNHCGYSYCHSCTDYRALMPRPSPSSGYDPVPICAFCVQYLSITAGGKGYLRSQSLGRLKNYMQAYNIRLGPDVLEKEDVINAILAARERNGCLPRSNENYYRKHAVPYGQNSRHGLFSRPERTRSAPRQNIDPRVPWAQTNRFARPDLQPDQPQSEQYARPQQQGNQQQQRQQPYYAQNNQYAPPPNPPPHTPYTSNQQSFSAASPGRHASGTPPQPQRNNSVPNDSPQANHSSDSRSRTTSAPNRSANTSPNAQSSAASSTSSRMPPVPTLDELLTMQEDEVAALSVGSLKEVLNRNHVPARLVLEKSELVTRVVTLVATERRERARMEAVHEREAWEAQEREWAARERERAARAREREAREREAREREREQERGRRRETYRTTVESASDSDGDSGVHLHSAELNPEARDRASFPPPPSPPIPDTQESSPQAARDDSPEPPAQPRPERSGLCVVCQDEEANIVIVDCGHLALCRACADLIWGSSRECPLCRTRIITESRLLRIFKA